MSGPSLPIRPPFSSLPLDSDGPPGNAWGLYGPDDQLGALNLLTPTLVAEAAKSEIRTGERISLDWSLDKPFHPNFERQPFQSCMINSKRADGARRYVNDDILHFNTQCSTQWDGFRHYGYQTAQRYYNNKKHQDLETTGVLGIDGWAANGGIVGRGILLDYARFAKRHSIPLNPLSSSAITVEQLQQIVAEDNLSIRPGDILFIRVGFTAAYEALDLAEQKAIACRPSPDFLGVESSCSMLRWIWESGFAAVASDAPSFEQSPWQEKNWDEDMRGGGLLHQWLLGGWGLPIGEMFDLEKLSRTCEVQGRWNFFLSSVPLKVPGGVASPPNAIAIF